MLVVWGLLLFVVGILIQNNSVVVRRKMGETGYKQSTMVSLYLSLICWVLLVLGGLFLLFQQAWWLALIALIIGSRFVKR